MLDGYLFGQDPMPTSAELFERASQLESRAINLDAPKAAR